MTDRVRVVPKYPILRTKVAHYNRRAFHAHPVISGVRCFSIYSRAKANVEVLRKTAMFFTSRFFGRASTAQSEFDCPNE
jgi:hypothetical protein